MRVLLIDDDADVRLVASTCLEVLGGFETVAASNGDDGVALAVASRPDVILLDVMMPGKDGLMVLLELRDRPGLAGVPVVFMTAKVQPSEVAHYLEAGAVGVIRKPFDPFELVQEVRRYVASEA